MLDKNDIRNRGNHDYDKESAIIGGTNMSFSVGVFQWIEKYDKKKLKRSKAIVRVSGLVSNKENVFLEADKVVQMLDNGATNLRKTIIVK